VILAVLAAVVRPQKHSELIVSWRKPAYKRVGLHYIAAFRSRHCKRGTCCCFTAQESSNRGPRDEHGLEIDPRYCDVIVRRWQEFTGNKAILDQAHKSFEQVATERSRIVAW